MGWRYQSALGLSAGKVVRVTDLVGAHERGDGGHEPAHEPARGIDGVALVEHEVAVGAGLERDQDGRVRAAVRRQLCGDALGLHAHAPGCPEEGDEVARPERRIRLRGALGQARQHRGKSDPALATGWAGRRLHERLAAVAYAPQLHITSAKSFGHQR